MSFFDIHDIFMPILIDVMLIIGLIKIRDSKSFVYRLFVKNFGYEMILYSRKDLNSIIQINNSVSEKELEDEFRKQKKRVVGMICFGLVVNNLIIYAQHLK